MSSTCLQPPSVRKPKLQLRLLLTNTTHTLSALVDSGAEANIMDAELARQLGIGRHHLSPAVHVRALDGHPLGMVTHISAPVIMLLSRNHQEFIQFYLLHSPGQPLILGYPWLRQHNPHLYWETGVIREWGRRCHQTCLKEAPCPPTPSLPARSPTFPMHLLVITASEKFLIRLKPPLCPLTDHMTAPLISCPAPHHLRVASTPCLRLH